MERALAQIEESVGALSEAKLDTADSPDRLPVKRRRRSLWPGTTRPQGKKLIKLEEELKRPFKAIEKVMLAARRSAGLLHRS